MDSESIERKFILVPIAKGNVNNWRKIVERKYRRDRVQEFKVPTGRET